MIINYLPSANQFSSHWAVVVGVGAAFLLAQLVLSLRLYLRARRHDRALERLCDDLARGGDGRGHADSIPDSFGWLRWVLTAFPAGTAATATRGNFTRDEVLHELDTRIASDWSYLLLQRMGIMAPLLGVVLTVVGFYWLKIDETGEQSLQTILMAVTPLISGVGAGAVLALLNQALLQGVGGRLERLRMTARSWFDAAIWPHAGTDAPAATASAVAALERFARAVAASAEKHSASSGRMDASTTSMQAAAAQFEDVVRLFHGEIKGIPQALSVLREAMAASSRALQELIPVGARAVSNLDVSVAAFRTTIDHEFTDAAKLHLRSSKLLVQLVQDIADSTDLLKIGAEEMKQAAEANAASLQRVDQSLTDAANGLAGAGEHLRSLGNRPR